MSDLLLAPVYKLYERRLWNEIKDGPLPNHVGIIPDGNRRWARDRREPLSSAYYQGYRKLREVLIWLLEMGVKNVTVFALSSENCSRRSREELDTVMSYIKLGLEELLSGGFVDKYKVKVRSIGKVECLSDDLRDAIRKVTEHTSNYDERKLNIAICYGGRQEILDAVKKLMSSVDLRNFDPDKLNEELFRSYFYLPDIDDMDLVIRTSGEIRISNFLLWHIAYSELFFCEVYWPEFRRIDLWRAIRSFQKRKRNFGA
ncbi:polyprenyl diphosphate synthase [Sulfodiicoccus acidiphilus]|uniref:polyprenyl diphosphate synthase n=1 Tax=Sulfodiicoccus acidiphilus TaxID=1670455 RepID=UPI0035713BF6